MWYIIGHVPQGHGGLGINKPEGHKKSINTKGWQQFQISGENSHMCQHNFLKWEGVETRMCTVMKNGSFPSPNCLNKI